MEDKLKQEESGFVCGGICLAIVAGVNVITTGTMQIIKKKRQNEEAARQARQRYRMALIEYNEQRKAEGRKKITTEMFALTGIVLAIILVTLMYKFTFAVKVKN